MVNGRPAKRRRVTPPIDDDVPSETIQASDLLSRVADWDLEQAYEQRTRKKQAKETTRLPTKSQEGLLLQAQSSALPEDSDQDSFLQSGSEDEAANGLVTPPSEVEIQPTIPVRQQVLEAKEEIARLAGLLNENPEEHASAFKKLAQLGDHAPVPVQKLVLAAQVAVYKDAIPGYRIRAYRDEDLGNKVSKEVRQTRQYEHSLVTNYGSYVKHLASLAKPKADDADAISLQTVAVSCACSLLLAVPHFNYRTELLGILAQQLLSREPTPDFVKCIETVKGLFDSDDDGATSLEAVNIISKIMRAKDFRVRAEVVDCFLHLRLLTELAPVQSRTEGSGPRPMETVHGKKVKKQKWEHRSKKEKKIAKERKAVEKDMREADASVNFEEREKMQSEALKAVFATYFRILKARTSQLMGAVLEGLAKYAHLINQDMFGDILEALKDIVKQAEEDTENTEDTEDAADEGGRNFTRESLLATQTAFTLLSQQDVAKSAGSLQLDLSFFSSHIYRTLYSLGLDPDIELGPKSLRLDHPENQATQRNRVNVSTPMLLLVRVMKSILLTPSQPPPTMTATAFYKRLLSISLQLPEKSALAVLNLMERIADRHVRKIEALWYSDERKGDGVFHGESDTIEGTNILAMGTGVWEQELLRKHYCPKVREQVVIIDKIVSKNAQK
ncbi:Nucleolar complex-associated protein 3 [Cyphellophora attinorum]|uniref:Nucleolar complex-associated protein 3 n=1 Tax=Cyphellophora attinorum TaxID=1664694 RepID=A0A0N1NVH3_9EURO|nr:Nucleolar complex-associated protein 3 [Phialophora attinorum]KPI35044.1 Nucleolar complex-associated protein 3 [Phialophora attinorum]